MQILKQESRYEKYAQVLEITKVRQIKNAFTDGQGGFCAFGLLLKKFGNDIHQDGHVLGSIIQLNDYEGLSFKEIAEWLRHQ